MATKQTELAASVAKYFANAISHAENIIDRRDQRHAKRLSLSKIRRANQATHHALIGPDERSIYHLSYKPF